MDCCPCFGGSSSSSSEGMVMKGENRGKEKRKAGNEVFVPPPTQRASRIDAEREEKMTPKRISTSSIGLGSKKEDSSVKDRTSSGREKLFTYEQLVFATQNFKQDSLIGEGGFGRVYKGFLDSIGKVVAVKQLNTSGLQGNREFLTEVLMLTLLDHPNLVKLIGYCADGDQRLLVYEYMPLGSLEDHLYDIGPHKKPLDWNTRMKIVHGAAKGLEYLHNVAKPPVIYRDMKSSNILLGEGYFPKLSDFGLAKIGPVGDKTHVSTRVMGTYGYCAPEYAMTGQLTTKSDIFSFGVLFLEIITGRKAIDCTKSGLDQNLVAWSRPLFKDRRNFPRMADPLLEGRYPARGLYQAIAIAAMCVHEQAAERPVIADIVSALEYLASQTYNSNSQNRSVEQSPSHHSPDLSRTDAVRRNVNQEHYRDRSVA